MGYRAKTNNGAHFLEKYTVARTIMLIPTSANVGLTSVNLGIIRAIEHKGVRLTVFKPITESKTSNVSLSISHVESLLSTNQNDVLMEEVIANYHKATTDAEVILVEGLIPSRRYPFVGALNNEIARTLNAEILFVMSQDNASPTQLKERIELAKNGVGGNKNKAVTGVIINKLNAPVDDHGRIRHDLSGIFDDTNGGNCVRRFPTSKKFQGVIQNDSTSNTDAPSASKNITKIQKITHFDAEEYTQLISDSPLPILGCIPWNLDLIATRALDMCRHLNATVINEGELNTRRVKSVTFCAHSLPHMLAHIRPGSLLVTSGDRPDVLVAICLAAMNGIEIGAILLTGGYEIDPHIYQLCERAFQTGLPVLMVTTNTWQTSLNLQSFSLEVPDDDTERTEKVQEYVASYIAPSWIDSLTAASVRSRRLSPPAFRYQLTELARQAGKRIVLPEGDEPRTVKAAAICAKRGIAHCVLLGNPDEIHRVAAAQGLELGKGIDIVDPLTRRDDYVARLVELRKNKGMTEVVAREQLEDNVVLGTMMLENNEVDGLVSGAVHTTVNTIRPPLQLIKTSPESSLVSSIFFMLLPEQVLVYGDCAINPDPSAEQLAEIAIQSADSAAAFGIEPRVAMISYSTGTSGSGSDVDKVREATKIAQTKRPDLVIDGPLQYDAAVMEDVAKSKAPNSQVAGRATVFIFPDLNTGNTTYKAVQRSADLISIGPMLQGMRKPVNDLSRGALVDDIVYTIALTAIQASQQKESSQA